MHVSDQTSSILQITEINQMDNLDRNNRVFYLVMTGCPYKNVLKII